MTLMREMMVPRLYRTMWRSKRRKKMMMKSTQMTTRTTSIWRSLKKYRKRPLISKKMKR